MLLLPSASGERSYSCTNLDALDRPETESTVGNQNQLTTKSEESMAEANVSEAAQPQHHLCVVCGEGNAKIHYGVFACLGCKGFFRRALKKANEYECLRNNNCVINKYERNSCRACRLIKCLEAGMDPASVRPDRDFISRSLGSRRMSSSSSSNSKRSSQKKEQELELAESDSAIASMEKLAVDERRCKSGRAKSFGEKIGMEDEGFVKRLPLEMRTMLMTLQNIEAKVVHGDTTKDASEIYPLKINNIKEVIDQPDKLRGRRTEMRYEPYRMARNEELSAIVYRRLIAAIDWVEYLTNELLGGVSVEDRIALVKSCFGPLMLFKCTAKTAIVTEKDILCLCNFAYVPRNFAKAYNDAYHLDNGLVERLLNELVLPFRSIRLSEAEVVCLSAIIVLNPMARDLSERAAGRVSKIRERVNATLYSITKECRPNCRSSVVAFGNLLLYLPLVQALANSMCENLRFAQTFSTIGGIPLLTSLFGCFPVEPFVESDLALYTVGKNSSDQNRDGASSEGCKLESRNDVQTQTEAWIFTLDRPKKRCLAKTMKTIQEDESEPSAKEFCLLRAPGSYTLAEMFDDRINYVEDSSNNQQQHEQRDGLPPNEQQKMIPRTSGSSYMVQNRNQQPSETFWNQQQPRRTTISKQLSMPNIAWNPCNLQQQQQQFYGSADEMQKFAEFNTPSRQRGIQMASPTVSAMPVQVPYRIGESQAQRTSHQYYCSPYPHQPPPMQGCSSRSSEYYTHQFSPSMHNSLPYEMNSQGHLAPNSYCYPTQNTTLYYPTPATYNNSSAYFNNNTSQ